MKLYRNISIKEYLTLIQNEKIEGKMHKENKDSTYRQSDGGSVFFFEHGVDLTMHSNAYNIVVEATIPEERINGVGHATYTMTNGVCDCCDFVVDESTYKEYYVSYYTLHDIVNANIDPFFTLDQAINGDIFFDFLMEGLKHFGNRVFFEVSSLFNKGKTLQVLELLGTLGDKELYKVYERIVNDNPYTYSDKEIKEMLDDLILIKNNNQAIIKLLEKASGKVVAI